MIIQYVPSFEHDTILEVWYHQLRQSGDLTKLFHAPSRHLSAFLKSFQLPTVLSLDILPDHTIAMAMWFEPHFSAVMTGLWIHPEHRNSPRILAEILRQLDAALTSRGLVLGITKQRNLLEPHRKLGYNISAVLPGAFDGEDAWLVSLTRDGFEKGAYYGWFRRRQGRRQCEQRHLSESLKVAL